MSKERETYLKFKSMADDLRQAESWCESDGVLNRNKTMQNLYKMGYRKQSVDGLILTVGGATGYFPKEFIEEAVSKSLEHKQSEGEWVIKGGYFQRLVCTACGGTGVTTTKFCPNCGAKMHNKTLDRANMKGGE